MSQMSFLCWAKWWAVERL